MDIEERELFYLHQAPLRAWRLFRVRSCGGGLVLSSPMYRDPEPPAWPAAGSRASCFEGHRAPARGCRCGIYAAIEGTLDSLPGYLLDTVHDRDPWAYTEVACSGRVFVDMRGVRAERAEVLWLAADDSNPPAGHTRETADQLLRKRYGVPVCGLVDVPAWVTDNRRHQGPPTDEVDLRLDLDKLDLWV